MTPLTSIHQRPVRPPLTLELPVCVCVCGEEGKLGKDEFERSNGMGPGAILAQQDCEGKNKEDPVGSGRSATVIKENTRNMDT